MNKNMDFTILFRKQWLAVKSFIKYFTGSDLSFVNNLIYFSNNTTYKCVSVRTQINSPFIIFRNYASRIHQYSAQFRRLYRRLIIKTDIVRFLFHDSNTQKYIIEYNYPQIVYFSITSFNNISKFPTRVFFLYFFCKSETKYQIFIDFLHPSMILILLSTFQIIQKLPLIIEDKILLFQKQKMCLQSNTLFILINYHLRVTSSSIDPILVELMEITLYYPQKPFLFYRQNHLQFYQNKSIYNLLPWKNSKTSKIKHKSMPKFHSKRIQLVEEVLKKDKPISLISKRLGIKLSTAKLIVKKYKEEGSFFEKRSNRLQRLAAQRHNQEKKVSECSMISAPSMEVNGQKALSLLYPNAYVFNPQQISIHAQKMYIINNSFSQLNNSNLPFYYPAMNYFYPYA